MLVVETLLIVILGLLPSLFSLLIIPRAKQRLRARINRARIRASYRYQWSTQIDDNTEAVAPQKFIGDLSCRFNAHSPYLRCAVNPSGPCDECWHYERG